MNNNFLYDIPIVEYFLVFLLGVVVGGVGALGVITWCMDKWNAVFFRENKKFKVSTKLIFKK